jgi:hypothetical protein
MVLVEVTSVRKSVVSISSLKGTLVLLFSNRDRFNTSSKVPEIVAKQEMRSQFLVL